MEWQFDRLASGTFDGWNHPGLAHFRASALTNLVREILQNSLDNPDPDNDEHTPVQVRFIEHSIKREDIPGIDGLMSVISDCFKEHSDSNAEAKKGIQAALDMSKRQTLKVLEISDYNTTGMPGPAARKKPFHNYLFTSGDSVANADRGGSHGLGKFAPLANTPLRTLFVNTRWEDGTQEKSLFQGLSILSSRTGNDGSTLGQRGYFGDANFQPFEVVPDQFEWMDRSLVGTSIFIIGWDSPEKWEATVIAHALINFFAAFARNKLELIVQKSGAKEQVVSFSEGFEQFFSNKSIRDAISSSVDEGIDKLDNARFYLDCIKGENGVIEQETQINPDIGASKVTLLFDEDAPQKIAFIRNNIFISDQIPYFFKRSSREFNNFAGIFEVENEEGYKLLRSMENPSHTELNVDWLPFEDRKSGTQNLKNLGQKLKDIIKDKASVSMDIESGPIEILKKFFSDAAGEGADDLENEDIDPSGKFKIYSRPPKVAPPPLVDIEEREEEENETLDEENGLDGGSAQSGRSGHGSTAGHGPGHGKGTGGTGSRGARNTKKHMDTISIQSKRIISITGDQVTIVLKSLVTAPAKIILHEVGADFSQELTIKSSTEGTVHGNGLLIELKEGAKHSVSITCHKEIIGGVKLVVKEAS